MTQFAPVANLATYRELLRRDLLGTYHLLIATEVIKDPEAWDDFWTIEYWGPSRVDPFIIMDNGLIETGQPTDPQTLKEAADAVGASCIVLPDVLGDCRKTIKAVQSAYPELSKLGYPMMGVVQGRNWEEIAFILDFYNRLDISYLSVPRVMVEIFGTRTKLISRCRGDSGAKIHLLGFSENLYDDMLSANEPGVMGIDSAVPLWYSGLLPPTPPINANFGRRPADYWTRPSTVPVYSNVERVREWLRTFGVLRAPTDKAAQQVPEGTR